MTKTEENKLHSIEQKIDKLVTLRKQLIIGHRHNPKNSTLKAIQAVNGIITTLKQVVATESKDPILNAKLAAAVKKLSRLAELKRKGVI